jgi:hypothetical protein
MFDNNDPEPEPFNWGRREWATEFLGDLACNPNGPEAQTRALAKRAFYTGQPFGGEPDRLWPRFFAARVISPDCPPAKGLPDDMRRQLEQLAAPSCLHQRGSCIAPPDPVE